MMRRIAKDEVIVGVDEVGRGPLAGPVAVCAVSATPQVLRGIKREVFFTDSKRMSGAKREAVYNFVRGEVEKGKLIFAVSFVSAKVIDREGIVEAIFKATSRSIKRIGVSESTCILLDGGLKAPKHFSRQMSIKKGDLSEDAIALASVLAKVSRDRRMERYDGKFPGYGFSSNSGYGTKTHIDSIRLLGPSDIHRKSFIKGLDRS